jgi:hypothetical protein
MSHAAFILAVMVWLLVVVRFAPDVLAVFMFGGCKGCANSQNGDNLIGAMTFMFFLGLLNYETFV